MLARQGANVAFIDRAACLIDDHTKGDVEAMGRRSICVGGDVTDPASCAETVEETLGSSGGSTSSSTMPGSPATTWQCG